MLSWIELLSMKDEFDVKSRNWKEQESIKERGTKRYQERLVEEEEAEKEIRNYREEKEEIRDNDDNNPTIS